MVVLEAVVLVLVGSMVEVEVVLLVLVVLEMGLVVVVSLLLLLVLMGSVEVEEVDMGSVVVVMDDIMDALGSGPHHRLTTGRWTLVGFTRDMAQTSRGDSTHSSVSSCDYKTVNNFP